MAPRKRIRTSMTTRSSTQAHQETPKSESEIAVVSTADNSQVQPAESSPAIVTSQPKPSSQPAVTQSSHSEEHHRKTTSDIWAHLVQSGQGDKLKAPYKYCNKLLTAESSSGTNHLW
ncbi:hypothetical protein PSTG_02204 [Puccinia striiformis f. sp. tritici PST-78]|uniref:Uncharacterized protein n=1 Tax=Puccinia striiformis f. sp. tritici PST-78 TaxID=1165861 RepID=A0A0L0VZT0_9BASI|nr:hypothetical protein PSTG_02204 [Puccinia striiformis f. sp. tritici PST-78]